MSDRIDHLDEGRRNVIWLWNAVDVGGKVRFSLGICQETGKIALVSPNIGGLTSLTPMIVRDLYLNGDGCEEEVRCLNFECPRNRTTYASYTRQFRWAGKMFPTKADFRTFAKRIKEIGELLKEEVDRLDLSEHQIIARARGDEVVPFVEIKRKHASKSGRRRRG